MIAWLPVLISAAMLAVSLAAFLRTRRKDHASEATERAIMAADLRYIRLSVDDIRAESRTIRGQVQALESRISKAEASTAAAHQRLDDYFQGGHV